MTIKELNKIRGDIFSAGLENAEIKKALDVAGIAYLYELTELPDKHASIVLTARAQMNAVLNITPRLLSTASRTLCST